MDAFPDQHHAAGERAGEIEPHFRLLGGGRRRGQDGENAGEPDDGQAIHDFLP